MMLKKLYHYRETPLEKLESLDYSSSDHYLKQPISSKPYGLWVSVEDYEDDMTWELWCQREEFYPESLQSKHQVKLKETARILHLKTAEEIHEFGFKYRGNNQDHFDRFVGVACDPYVYLINWVPVKEAWDGIIIAPYNWECRIPSETSWYYGWDCASGCIWNLDCIEEFSLVEQLVTADNLQM